MMAVECLTVLVILRSIFELLQIRFLEFEPNKQHWEGLTNPS